MIRACRRRSGRLGPGGECWATRRLRGRLRTLLTRVRVEQLSISQPAPDRFVYSVQYGEWQLTVPEQDLTPELRQVVQIVLTRGS